MKQNSLVVALNFNGLSVSEKILRAKQVIESIADNPTVFTTLRIGFSHKKMVIRHKRNSWKLW